MEVYSFDFLKRFLYINLKTFWDIHFLEYFQNYFRPCGAVGGWSSFKYRWVLFKRHVSGFPTLFQLLDFTFQNNIYILRCSKNFKKWKNSSGSPIFPWWWTFSAIRKKGNQNPSLVSVSLFIFSNYSILHWFCQKNRKIHF